VLHLPSHWPLAQEWLALWRNTSGSYRQCPPRSDDPRKVRPENTGKLDKPADSRFPDPEIKITAPWPRQLQLISGSSLSYAAVHSPSCDEQKFVQFSLSACSDFAHHWPTVMSLAACRPSGLAAEAPGVPAEATEPLQLRFIKKTVFRLLPELSVKCDFCHVCTRQSSDLSRLPTTVEICVSPPHSATFAEAALYVSPMRGSPFAAEIPPAVAKTVNDAPTTARMRMIIFM
jgi:hypothetical protein